MTTSFLTLAYVVGLVGGVWLRCFRSRTFLDFKKPVPVGEKMFRSAGHSLALEVDKRMERLLIWVSALCLGPLPFLVSVGKVETGQYWFGWSVWLWFLLLLVAGFACSLVLSWQIKTLSNYVLGLNGERLVGEMLHWMMKDGFEVFHDYPIEPDGKTGNIDHVLVGPNGVFAIETKTYRKPKEAPEGKNYEVKFDGKRLVFPHRTTKKGIGQATNNARLLGKHLSASLDLPVEVTPILALPGWFVEGSGSGPLIVKNPKNIRSSILKSPSTIDDSLKRKISYQLELRCRDVEF